LTAGGGFAIASRSTSSQEKFPMASIRRALCVCVISLLPLSTASVLAQEVAKAPATVVATQGSATVTLADVDAFAERIPEKDRAAFFGNPQRLESLITNLLVQKQLSVEARAAGMDRDPAVQAQMSLATDDVLGKVRMQAFKRDLKLPDFNELAREDYVGNKERYALPGKLDVKHILISTASRSEDEARALADKVEKEAQANPDGFGDLIEKYSDDPSKVSNHGLMVDVVGGQYVPEFVAASKALTKPGALSPVVKTKFGFHVIKLVRHTADRQRDFNEVKGEIVTRLRDEYIEKAVTGHTNELRNLPMQASPDVVASLRTRFGSVDTPANVDAKAAAGGK
jgi:parvulin-like peptidyl-prolyl isomerase